VIIQWSQHNRPNAPQHAVLSRNVVKGQYTAPLVIVSVEPKSRGMLAAKHVRRAMRRGR